jgi:hypothetical protein
MQRISSSSEQAEGNRVHIRLHIRFLGKGLIFATIQFWARCAVNLVGKKKFILLKVEALIVLTRPSFPQALV